MQIPISDIIVKERKRKINTEKVKELAESIAQIGMLQPIGIRPDKTLVFGYHRLAAANMLGWETVPVVIVDDSGDDGGLKAELAEIDENLARAELTILERAEHLARRKEIYEALHPETKAGVAQAVGMHRALGHNVGAPSAPTSDNEKIENLALQAVGMNRALGYNVGATVAPTFTAEPRRT